MGDGGCPCRQHHCQAPTFHRHCVEKAALRRDDIQPGTGRVELYAMRLAYESTMEEEDSTLDELEAHAVDQLDRPDERSPRASSTGRLPDDEIEEEAFLAKGHGGGRRGALSDSGAA